MPVRESGARKREREREREGEKPQKKWKTVIKLMAG